MTMKKLLHAAETGAQFKDQELEAVFDAAAQRPSAIEEIHDAYQDTLQGLMADLETGSHHMNNVASEEFNRRYQYFMQHFNRLGELINREYDKEDTPC
jgi:cyclopropane fatty-acyl-phospholipid synthase-like methyltransferase